MNRVISFECSFRIFAKWKIRIRKIIARFGNWQLIEIWQAYKFQIDFNISPILITYIKCSCIKPSTSLALFLLKRRSRMLCIKATTMNEVKSIQTTNWHLFLFYQRIETLTCKEIYHFIQIQATVNKFYSANDKWILNMIIGYLSISNLVLRLYFSALDNYFH